MNKKKHYLRPFQIGKMGGKFKKKKRKRKDIFTLSRSSLRGGAEAGRFRGGPPEKKLKEEGQGRGGGVVGCRGGGVG